MNKMLTQKSTVILIALLFVGGISFAGLSREGKFAGLKLLPSAKAQTEQVSSPEAASQAEGAAQHENAPARCRSVLIGRYADAASASVIPGGFAPAVCAGVVTFDGRGKLTAEETHSFNGLIIQQQYKGTVTYNENCTGTMTLIAVGGALEGLSTTQNFVITEENKEIIYTVTDPGVVSSGTMKKM